MRPPTVQGARRLGTGALGLLVSAIAVVALVAAIDLGATVETLSRTDLRLVAATLVLVPGQILLRTLRWQLLLPVRADGGRPPARRVLPVLLVGYLANLVLPARLGEPVRAYLLSRREQLGFSRVLGSVLLERVMDLATLAFVAIGAAVVSGAPDWIVRGMVVVAVVGFGLVAVLVASGIPRAIRVLARLVGAHADRMRSAVNHAISFGEGANGGGWGHLALAVLLSTATWFFVAATYWITARSLGFEISMSSSMLVAAVTTLGTAIPSAPANIGTFEAAGVLAATAVGVPAPDALALALLVHAIVTVPFAVAGVAAVTTLSVSLADVADEAVTAAPLPEGSESGA